MLQRFHVNSVDVFWLDALSAAYLHATLSHIIKVITRKELSEVLIVRPNLSL